MEHELYFFTGENDYALEKELLRWKTGFCEKHGMENFLQLDSREATLSQLMDAVSVLPFIAEKRLVIIRGLPKIEKEDFASFTENIHPQVLVLIVESKPDKRLGITKVITELAKKKEFKPLTIRELTLWAKDVAAREGALLTDAAWQALLDITGANQWVLDTEIRKLSIYALGDITPEHVDILAIPSGEQVVWKLTDLIGSRNAEKALQFLDNRLERGEDAYGLWVILLNMIKNTTLVWSGVQEGLQGEKRIADAFGMHPFAVRGLLPLARSLSAEQMSELVEFGAQADIAVKTGGHHCSVDRQEELISLTERAILMCR